MYISMVGHCFYGWTFGWLVGGLQGWIVDWLKGRVGTSSGRVVGMAGEPLPCRRGVAEVEEGQGGGHGQVPVLGPVVGEVLLVLMVVHMWLIGCVDWRAPWCTRSSWPWGGAKMPGGLGAPVHQG